MPRPSVKDQRKRELTEAAIGCIARKGLQQTTITDVSEAAGLSRGIINFYFSTKDAMLKEALSGLLEGFLARAVKEAQKLPPAQAFEGFISAHFQPDICNQKRMNVWLEFCGAATSNRALRDCFETYAQAWQEQCTQYLKDAGREAGPENISRITTLISGVWVQAALGQANEARAAAGSLLPHLLPAVRSAPARKEKQAPVAKKSKSGGKTGSKAAQQLDFGDLFAVKS